MRKVEEKLEHIFGVESVFRTIMRCSDRWSHTALRGGEVVKW